MKRLILTVELTYDDDIMHADDPESVEFFRQSVLMDGVNVLHNNDPIGDILGEVKILDIKDVPS